MTSVLCNHCAAEGHDIHDITGTKSGSIQVELHPESERKRGYAE
jgi:hypothetical protein